MNSSVVRTWNLCSLPSAKVILGFYDAFAHRLMWRSSKTSKHDSIGKCRVSEMEMSAPCRFGSCILSQGNYYDLKKRKSTDSLRQISRCAELKAYAFNSTRLPVRFMACHSLLPHWLLHAH